MSDIVNFKEARVVAVVVTHERKELLRKCLNALLNQESQDFKIVVVDNASADGTREYINDLIDGNRVYYVNTGENIGGAGGFNIGIKRAFELGCDYVWLMDDDCIVQDGALKALLDGAESLKGNFGFLSSAAIWTDGKICKMTAQRKSLAKTISGNEKTLTRIKLASFVSLFLNAEAVRSSGLPIKEFFIWADDWEYTGRISRKFKNYLVPSSVVVHASQNNGGVDVATDDARLDRYFYAYRNEAYFYKTQGICGGIYHFLKIVYHRLKIALSGSPLKKEKLQIIKKGLNAAKSFKPDIEYLND